MRRFSLLACVGYALVGLAACGAPLPPSPVSSGVAPSGRDELRRVVERYWDERMALGESISPQALADALALERRYLGEALAVPRASLDAESTITYDIFKRQRELAVEGYTYPAELIPIDPFEAMPVGFARAAADIEVHPLATVKDYERWLARIDEYVRWSEQAVLNMREGMRRGYTTPRSVIDRTLPVLASLGEDTSENFFYAPVRAMPVVIKDPDRARLSAQLDTAVRNRLLPSYRSLYDFLKVEYLPRTRTSLGLSALPLGSSWYGYLVKRYVGTAMPATELQNVGVAEVERLRLRMLPLLGHEPTPGVAVPSVATPTLPSPMSQEEVLAAYGELESRTKDAMPALFAVGAQGVLDVRLAPAYLIGDAPLFYEAATADGRSAAILYVDKDAPTPPSAMRSAMRSALRPAIELPDFLQNVLPGRHYQAALQRARADLPRFRRFGTDPAFTEGWGLYAASLGEELGLYSSDEARLGGLQRQMRCAASLVVDVGLHAKEWTRAQALDYLHAHLTIEDSEANLMVDRYAALPGAALACTIGELKLMALRTRAQQAQGTAFEMRDFHAQILKDGAMPLDILEGKVQPWMKAK